jgi:hypothetical protein
MLLTMAGLFLSLFQREELLQVKHSMRSFLLLSHLLLPLMERMLIYQLKSLQ